MNKEMKHMHTSDLAFQPTEKEQELSEEQAKDPTLKALWKKAEQKYGPRYTKTAKTSLII